MTITRTTSGGNTTYTLTFTAPTARIDATVEMAARLFHREAHIEKAFEAMSLLEKLSLVESNIQNFIVSSARFQRLRIEEEAARLTVNNAGYGV